MELHHIMMLIHHKLYDSYKLYYCQTDHPKQIVGSLFWCQGFFLKLLIVPNGYLKIIIGNQSKWQEPAVIPTETEEFLSQL